ncbi:signal peptidase II [Citricoccus nitrophenolicus]|uniref:Lipoprotein signal peptidase n=1 Tax=Citricoccus nitrophenolicus TaxID=863575 RepID=A0ABV0IMK1_9MICC
MLLTVGIGIGVAVLDQVSKWWAVNTLSMSERVPILGDLLGLQLVYNPGAAFSLGTDATWIFTIISAVAVGVAIWFTLRVRTRSWAVVIGCLGGAAASHLGDRLLRPPSFAQGHIVDFIAYGDWFIGNIADIFIVGGVVAVLLLSTTEHNRDTAEAQQ